MQQSETREKPSKVVRSITLTEELSDRLDLFRTHENRSFTNAVVTILKRYLDNYDVA